MARGHRGCWDLVPAWPAMALHTGGRASCSPLPYPCCQGDFLSGSESMENASHSGDLSEKRDLPLSPGLDLTPDPQACPHHLCWGWAGGSGVLRAWPNPSWARPLSEEAGSSSAQEVAGLD